MIPSPFPSDEAERLHALRSYDILDSSPEQAFDDLTALASHICGTPISTVTLIDDHRQWFKSRIGFDLAETPREVAFCAHTIMHTDLLVIPDTTADPRFRDNPLVTGYPNIAFYAGVPLIMPDGHSLGTLCVMDKSPRELSPAQKDMLRRLAGQAVSQLRLRKLTLLQAGERAHLEAALDMEKAILNSANFSIISTEADGTIRGFNAGATRLLGYTPEEVLGKTTPAILHDMGEVERRAEELTAELKHPIAPGFDTFIAKSRLGLPDEREWTYIHKNGNRFPVLLSVTPVRAKDGSITAYLGIARDITVQKRLEIERESMLAQLDRANKLLAHELESTQIQYKSLVEGSNEIIFSAEVDGTILTASQRVHALLGFRPEELIGRTLVSLTSSFRASEDLTRDAFRERIDSLGAQNPRAEFITELAAKNGEPAAMRVTLELVDIGRALIFGRASPAEDDLISRCCEAEQQRLRVGNSVSLIDAVSRRCTASAARYLTVEELEGVRLGLREMLMNSIEHGSLAISFEEKAQATEQGTFLQLLRSRQQDPLFKDRTVQVDYRLSPEEIEFVITDEGPGFDHTKMLSRDIRAKGEMGRKHGRGIALTRAFFDEVEFLGTGNSVRLRQKFHQKT